MYNTWLLTSHYVAEFSDQELKPTVNWETETREH
jgi:hypothetical protein